jgi:hypothetical protein
MNPAEACRLAQCLARNRGWHVFPCKENKRPATAHGFQDASNDPVRIAALWQRRPGTLIGVATGKPSGIDLLDLDIKHAEAGDWWRAYYHLIPNTETYRSRGGGLHLYFRSNDRLPNTTSKLAKGVDTKGFGGYVIYWAAIGCDCLDHSLPAPWPARLLAELTRKPQSQSGCAFSDGQTASRPDNADAAIEGLLRHVEHAREGTRNNRLHWASCRLGERVRAGQISRGEAERALLAAAIHTGLEEIGARATIRSGLERPS